MVDHNLYMHIATGSIGQYNDWYYLDDTGKEVNAVDLGEVVEVIQNFDGTYEIKEE